MKSTTYIHNLSGGWDKIKILDKNNAEVNARGIIVFFSEDIYIRGKEGEDEILITKVHSPMELTASANNDGFPLEIKGTGTLDIITIN